MQHDESKRTIWVRYIDEPRKSDVWEISGLTENRNIVPLAWFDSPGNRPHMGHLRADQVQTAEELTQTAASHLAEGDHVPAYTEEELAHARFLSALAGDPYAGIEYLVESRSKWCAVVAEEFVA